MPTDARGQYLNFLQDYVTKLERAAQQKDAQIELLTRSILELKKDGFQPKAEPPKQRKVKPPEQSDEEIVRIRDREAIDRMTLEFMKEGHTEAASRAEATRIRAESKNTTVHPSGS